MRLAALVPTRNRPETAARAIQTFMVAAASAGGLDEVRIVVADDSDDASAARTLNGMLETVRRRYSFACVEVLPASFPCHGGSGAGAARNRALNRLRSLKLQSDVTVMFDDDISFSSVDYCGQAFICDGAAVLREALHVSCDGRTIVGCGYLGRQDLSALEHLRLDARICETGIIAPAFNRGEIASFAPGGISTAFLTVAADAASLPNFAHHYNEDFLWLDLMTRQGWHLKTITHKVVHAPPGHVEFSPRVLELQVFGEIVWLAVSERDRYPVERAEAIASAVHEIVGDLRSAETNARLHTASHAMQAIADCRRRYEMIARRIAARSPCKSGQQLLASIRAGLSASLTQATPLIGSVDYVAVNCGEG